MNFLILGGFFRVDFRPVTFADISQKVDCAMNQKPGGHLNFRKNALGVKRPFSELQGIRAATVRIKKVILAIRNYILGMASHDLSNTKTTILRATPGAILGIDGGPTWKIIVCPIHSRSVLSGIGVVPALQNEHFRKFCGRSPRCADTNGL